MYAQADVVFIFIHRSCPGCGFAVFALTLSIHWQSQKARHLFACVLCRMLDEDTVVAMYGQQYRQMGQPFDAERCRSWFRSMKEKMNPMNMGMGMGHMMGLRGM